MSGSIKAIEKAMSKYHKNDDKFSIVYLVDSKTMDGSITVPFPESTPFYYDEDNNICMKPETSNDSELDRLNAARLHRGAIINIMHAHLRVYKNFTTILQYYDSILGINSFEDPDISKVL